MAEGVSSYKKVSLEEEITATEKRHNIPSMGERWHPQRAHFQMAGRLAMGLLVLFAITIACSGTAVTALIVAEFFSDNANSNTAAGIEQMVKFVATLIPYIATPLGVALGYFFKESPGE